MTGNGKTRPDTSEKPASTASGSPARIYAAVATPPGVGGIAEIHVWGAGSSALVNSLFRAKSGKAAARTDQGCFLYGHFVKNDEILDEVIVLRRETDRIYGAETVEIGCHGGGAAARAIIDALVEQGAAETDTEKALEEACAQGRISRIEVDAHRALRSCASEKALPVLLAELDKHHLEREIEEIHRLVDGSTTPEGMADTKPRTSVRGSGTAHTPALKGGASEAAVHAIRGLLENSWAIPYVEPQPVFIAGFPNVGKSSLFNTLAGRERVIVHETPGTTRDVVDELVMMKKVPVRLFDSAGVGESKTQIEKLSEEFAFRALREAALILFVFDGSRPVKETELKLYTQLDSESLVPIINKTDLPRAVNFTGVSGAMEVSALTGQGIPKLREEIAGRLARRPREAGEPVVFATRQRDMLKETLAALEAGNASKALELLSRLLR